MAMGPISASSPEAPVLCARAGSHTGKSAGRCASKALECLRLLGDAVDPMLGLKANTSASHSFPYPILAYAQSLA